MNISMRQALNRGQTKLDAMRQEQTTAAERRIAEARERVRQRQLAILEAFPVYIRRFVKFEYTVDNPTAAPSGIYEQVMIQVPELAPIKVFLINSNGWTIGVSGDSFRVPTVMGNEQLGVEWDFRRYFSTEDLDVALAMAHERGIQYRSMEAAFKKKQAPEPKYEEVDA